MSYSWTHLASQKAAAILNKLEPGFEEELARFIESVLPNRPEIYLDIQLDFILHKLDNLSSNQRIGHRTIGFLVDENYQEEAVELYQYLNKVSEETAREVVAHLVGKMTELEQSPIYSELKELLENGKTIEAMRLHLRHFREDGGLAYTQATIQRLQHKLALTNNNPSKNIDENKLREETLYLIKQGKNIDAIKYYRSVTGIGLADAFQVINELVAGSPPDKEFFFRRVTFLLKNGSIKRATEVFAEDMKISQAEAVKNIEQIQELKVHPADPIRDEIKKLLHQDPQTEAVKMLMERRGLTQAAALEIVAHIEES
jgi:ribosomal protein L7/L12